MHLIQCFARLLSLPLLMLPSAPLSAQEALQRAVPPGAAKSAKTRVLEAGAWALQADAPTDLLNIHLVGFHPSKGDPGHQMEAHHYCRQVNEEFAQCALFDGNGRNANLNGIEYIISARLFAQLPEEEKKYWHPHNYEILSGQLVAPNIPIRVEREVMEAKINSYGKTWHVWMTGTYGRAPDALPLGEPVLAWSFNRDGEASPGLVEQRDARLQVDTGVRRSARRGLTELAQPQHGVAALREHFPDARQDMPGVAEAGPPDGPQSINSR
jgi:hypothetical protein